MGFIAREMVQVPASGYSWYLYLLEDDWRDTISDTLLKNFDTLVKESGPGVLVVRGVVRADFTHDVMRTYGLPHEPPKPALFVSDQSPDDVMRRVHGQPEPKALVVTLRLRQDSGHSLVEVLARFTEALRDAKSIDALRDCDKSNAEKRWGWLRALELKPNWFGFGFNVNEPGFPIWLWYRTANTSRCALISGVPTRRTPPRRVTPCG